MKTQFIFLIALLMSVTASAQSNGDSTIAYFSSNNAFASATQQPFIYGNDTLFLDVACNAGILTMEPTSLTRDRIQIVDSIDLNEDGVKELFLFYEWTCESMPVSMNEFCVGCETHWNGRYEVWDFQKMQKVFEFQSKNLYQRIVSTNVVTSGGFEYLVTIDKKGSIHFEKLNKYENEENAGGTYKYDAASGAYILKK